MIIKAISTLFVVLSSAGLFAASDLSQFTPSSQTISGESYPRNDQILFRGMGDHQFELDRAIRAMLDDKTARIETKLFTTIKSELNDTYFPVAVSLPSSIRAEIQKRKSEVTTKASASEIAKEIVDEHFENMRGSTAIANYVDYRSGQYIDWPNDIVFSSIIQPAAGTYGWNMAMIKEKSSRSIDLNFYNYINNGVWYDHTRDVGEFAAFGYIEARDIVGFQVRDRSGNKGWHRIRYGFIKKEINKKSYIEVYDGEHAKYQTLSSCMTLDNAGDLYHCNYRPGSIAMTPPKLSQYKPTLIALIVLCDNSESDKECEKNYEDISVNSKSIDQDILNLVDKAKIKDKRILLIQ